MKLFCISLLCIVAFLPGNLCAQQKKIDSLQGMLKTAPTDTNRVHALNALTKLYWQTGVYDTALSLATEARELSGKLQFKRGIAGAYNNMGITYWRQGNYPEALKNYFSALRIAEELGDKRKMGAIYGNICNININQGELEPALKYGLLSISYAASDKKVLSNSYNSVANIYYRQAGLAKSSQKKRDSLLVLSIKNYSIARKINEETGNKINLAHNLNNMGLIYEMQARQFQLENKKVEAAKKFSEAKNLYLGGLALEEETGDRESAAGSYINLGNLHVAIGQYAAAGKFLDSALAISKEIGNLDDLKDSYFYAQVKDSAMGNFKSAYANYKNFIAVRDSLLNEENTRKSVQAQMNYEFGKKEALAKAEQEKKDSVAAADKKRQKVILFSISGLGLLVFGFAIFAYRSFLLKKKANREISLQKSLIEEKQKEILDSIYYARRIQRSLLPNEKYIARCLGRLKI